MASPESLQELPFTSVGFCNVYTNHVRVTDPHTEVTSCRDLKEVLPGDSLCKPVRKTLKSQTGAPSVSVYFCLLCPPTSNLVLRRGSQGRWRVFLYKSKIFL